MKTPSFVRKSLYSALVFFGTLLVLSVGYAAYTTMTSVGSNAPLTKDLWNQMVVNMEDLNARVTSLQSSAGNLWTTVTGGIGYSGGNVGIGTTNPQAKLEVAGDFIRTIARAQWYNQLDGTDNGAIATRILTFVKKQADTGIRITYSDVRRVLGTGNNAGRWETKFNGASCSSPGPLAWSIHESVAGSDYHRADTTIGTCFGLPAGIYTIQIYVEPAPGYEVSDLHTGWNGAWSLEAEEVR